MSQPESQPEQQAIAHEREPLPTIWAATDPMWENLFRPLLAEFDPPSKTGRPRADQRRCLDGIIYRARTGCQWNHLPAKFGSDSTVHRTLRRWDERGVFDRLWALLVYHCEELGSVHWEWQAADGCLLKARFIGDGQKGGSKRTRQTAQGQTAQTGKRAGERVKASAPARRTVASWASSRACWSRGEAARFLSASRART